MSKRANPKAIGAFVVGGIVLAVAGILAFGAGRFFETTQPLVMYFTESVQGLDVGAPIIYEGVVVGTVTRIDLRLDLADGTLSIPVRGRFLPTTFGVDGTPEQITEFRKAQKAGTGDWGRALVHRGLRAQLGMTSFVTGKLAVSLVMRPGSDITLVEADAELITPGGEFEVPTVPSDLAEVKATVEAVVRKIAELDLEEVVAETRSLITGFDALVRDPEIKEIIGGANRTVADLRSLINDVDSKVGPLAASATDALKSFEAAGDEGRRALADARGTLRNLDATLDRARTLLASANTVIQPDSAIHFELVTALRDIGSAARSVRALADALERDPNSILFGKRVP